MPNWASCSYRLYDSAEHLQEVMTAYDAVKNEQAEANLVYREKRNALARQGFSDATIVRTLSQCGICKGDDSVWLIDVLVKMGFPREEMRGEGNIRGYLCDDPTVSTSRDCLSFECEAAWGTPDGFTDLLRRRFPDLEFLYSCEESGNGLYVTNDPDIAGTRVVDSEQGDYQRCANDEEFTGFIAELARGNNDNDVIEDAAQAEAYIRRRNEMADRVGSENHIWVNVFELSD